MICPNCHENTHEIVTCGQCHTTGCPSCWPHYDYPGSVCPPCQELNTIAAVDESSHTSRLRRIFNSKAGPPAEPNLRQPLPWTVAPGHGGWGLYSGVVLVSLFDSEDAAMWACRASNEYYDLSSVARTVYERIRKGDGWWDGGEEDCRLWKRVKSLLK